MILEGSRYQNAPVLQVKAADGVTRPTIYSSPSFPPFSSFIYHRVQIGDRFDNIAAQYYGDPELWWQIASANPEVFYPEPDPGTIIRVPSGTT